MLEGWDLASYCKAAWRRIFKGENDASGTLAVQSHQLDSVL